MQVVYRVSSGGSQVPPSGLALVEVTETSPTKATTPFGNVMAAPSCATSHVGRPEVPIEYHTPSGGSRGT